MTFPRGNGQTPMESQEEFLVETRELSKHFPGPRPSILSRRAILRAVEKVNLRIRRGEVLGLVGESGCGKSTLGQTILNLYTPTSGQIFFEGEDIQELRMGELRSLRRKMQIVFQDPYSSLDPRMPIGQAIAEPLVIHKMASGSELEDRVSELLQTVGLNPGLRNRYPHEFSGGQQQRIALARALAVTPSFLVADEPISSMDVSIQGQLINLLERLREQMGLTYLFISHDLRMVRHIADRVAVMYLGRIVEIADCDELFDNALHPYTQALLSAVPITDPTAARTRKRIRLEGDVPSPIDLPAGCVFQSRCPLVQPECAKEEPELRQMGDGHRAACIMV